MTSALLGTLVVLALIDSTSFGTLLIPIWLMLAPGRLRPGAILVFLGTVAAFYLVLGLVLSAGLLALSEALADLVTTTPVVVLQLVLGVGLLMWSFRIGRKEAPGEGRLLRWRERAVGEGGSIWGLITLALGATAIEAASMVPYLGAIGLMESADMAFGQRALLLLGYCLVMVAPALVLLVVRLVAQRAIEPMLRRVNGWLMRSAAETTAWVVGIVGLLLAVNAADTLGLVDAIDSWSARRG